MGINYSPKIVTDGLVLCLDAANPLSYPGSGNVWYDVSTNQNNATIYNNPSINNGIITLSSTNDYIEIPKILQPETIDFWFNSPSSSNASIIYAGTDVYNSSSWQWSLYYYNSTLIWRPNAGGGGPSITSFVNLNVWYHFVMIRGATRKVYINGQEVSTWHESPTTVTGNIRIAKAGTAYWNGSVSMLKMYDRTLSNLEIQQNYLALKGRFGL